MLDSAIAAQLTAVLTAGLTARGVAANVVQNNQPRQFAAPSTPTIFFTPAPRKPFGWPARKDVYNATTGLFDTTKTQVVHTRFQIAGCAPNPSPAAPYALTSGDLAGIANSILTDQSTIATFVAAGFNVFRVQELPLVWFQDSTGQNVAWVSFDIIFTHKDTSITQTNVIDEFNGTFGSI